MPYAEEISQLEEELARTKEEISSAKNQLAAVKRGITVAHADIAAKKSALDSTVSILRHMRKVADHVVLLEFVSVKETEALHTEKLYQARVALAGLINLQTKFEETVLPDLLATRDVKQLALSQFGRLYHFPERATHVAV